MDYTESKRYKRYYIIRGYIHMQGIGLMIAFILSIILMIFAISKLKIHPFLSIMGVSLLLAIIAGIKLVDIPGIIGDGFSGTFKSIGIVIIFGAMIGTLLEKTGAAIKLSDMVVKLVGKKKPELAMLLMGWVVSIPVFCDSGFVILNPIRKALAKRTNTSSVAMTVALSAGLYVAHVMIPPTPGPIAAASTLGIGNNLLLVIGFGVLCSIFPLITGYLYAKKIGKTVKSIDETEETQETVKTYEELVAEFGKLPNGFAAVAPILVPIILMGISSIASMAQWSGSIVNLILFLGTPIIALSVGLLFGIALLAGAGKMDEFNFIANETLRTVGPILFVTAAGGVLGKVIAVSGLVEFITAQSDVLTTVGIFFPFIMAAILKSAQGSSTVAITTTAGIVAPLMVVLGLTTPALTALTVMAIGAGAMTVSHANDSYFWVVTKFGNMKVADGYKTQTMVTLLMGVSAMVEIFIISLFL